MLKRLCSLFLILALLFTLLPAQADIAPLTAQEIATVRAFIAMEGEGSSWQRGMAVTPQMNALQVQQYLEWLLSDEIGGLMNQVLDSAELLNLGQAGKGASLEGVGLTLQQLRNRITSYHDTLEQGRPLGVQQSASAQQQCQYVRTGQIAHRHPRARRYG